MVHCRSSSRLGGIESWTDKPYGSTDGSVRYDSTILDSKVRIFELLSCTRVTHVVLDIGTDTRVSMVVARSQPRGRT